jgi:hypothetical protein
MTQANWRNGEAVYEIRVEGVLDGSWSEWLGGLELGPLDSGETALTGPVRDQAALHRHPGHEGRSHARGISTAGARAVGVGRSGSGYLL